jgi:hypothetical protein
MDFIEQWFGVSPDGGNGVWEALCFAAVCVGILAFACRRYVRGLWRPSRSLTL